MAGEAADEALDCALRALEHRDRTQLEIERHLRARGFSDGESALALAALRRTGLVDDERFAQSRAASLADRGAGDALVRARLAEAGVTKDDADEAIATLESEAIRAGRIVASRGASAKTARYLCGKGFSEEVVSGAVADGADGELG
ncbi:MAG TPA: RecX family transcriptional regulator [Gaiellaceae bacterium]|nr:RecX family transcriptional regulator [Gaiellaceae bacterium]